MTSKYGPSTNTGCPRTPMTGIRRSTVAILASQSAPPTGKPAPKTDGGQCVADLQRPRTPERHLRLGRCGHQPVRLDARAGRPAILHSRRARARIAASSAGSSGRPGVAASLASSAHKRALRRWCACSFRDWAQTSRVHSFVVSLAFDRPPVPVGRVVLFGFRNPTDSRRCRRAPDRLVPSVVSFEGSVFGRFFRQPSQSHYDCDRPIFAPS